MIDPQDADDLAAKVLVPWADDEAADFTIDDLERLVDETDLPRMSPLERRQVAEAALRLIRSGARW